MYLPFRVRTGPSTSHPTVGSVKQGQVVQVVGEVQDWFKINYAGQTAYLSKDYVTKGGSNENVTQGTTKSKIIMELFKLVVLTLLTQHLYVFVQALQLTIV